PRRWSWGSRPVRQRRAKPRNSASPSSTTPPSARSSTRASPPSTSADPFGFLPQFLGSTAVGGGGGPVVLREALGRVWWSPYPLPPSSAGGTFPQPTRKAHSNSPGSGSPVYVSQVIRTWCSPAVQVWMLG